MAKELDYKKLVHEMLDKKFDLQKIRRKSMGMRELSPEIGVSPATLSRIMNGSKFDVDTFICLCEWLGRPLDYFLTEKEQTTNAV